MVSQLEELNDHFEGKPITEPVFFCESTVWRPSKLRTLEDFFFDIDTTKPNHFEEMRFRGQCREDLEYIEEMDGQEKDKYNTIVNRYK